MKILNRLPFATTDQTLDSPFGEILIRRYQIMVWVSLSAAQAESRIFPAIVDTGLNHNLAITDACLHSVNLRGDQLKRWGTARIDGEEASVRIADVRLHHNVRGTNRVTLKSPFKLVAPQGIVVLHGGFPRVPLLGLRCLVNSNLRVVINGREKTFSAATSWW